MSTAEPPAYDLGNAAAQLANNIQGGNSFDRLDAISKALGEAVKAGHALAAWSACQSNRADGQLEAKTAKPASYSAFAAADQFSKDVGVSFSAGDRQTLAERFQQTWEDGYERGKYSLYVPDARMAQAPIVPNPDPAPSLSMSGVPAMKNRELAFAYAVMVGMVLLNAVVVWQASGTCGRFLRAAGAEWQVAP